MSKKLINTGITDNDGSGTVLRVAGERINENFTEVYNAIGSPYNGTSYPDLAAAIKFIALTEVMPVDLLYISEILAGALIAGKYRYSVKIYNAISPSSDPHVDTPWLTYSKDENSRLNSAQRIILLEDDGSGVSGIMVIDWTKLLLQQYIPDGYLSGCLSSVASLKAWSVTKDSGLEEPFELKALPHITGQDQYIDGRYPLYLASSVTNIILENIENIRGPFTIKNINNEVSPSTISITTKDGLLIDGNNGIDISDGQSVTLYPNKIKYEAIGVFSPNIPI